MKPNLKDGRMVAELRKIIGKSQSQFAAMIGVSIHTVISVENGRNQLSEKLARRIQIATGADLLKRSKGKVAAVGGDWFTKKLFDEWRSRFSDDENSAKARFNEIKYWIELVLRAATKPGLAGNRDRLPAVFLSLVDWLNETRKTFKLEQEIDNILEEDPHEILNGTFGYEDLSTNEKMAKMFGDQLEMKPKELLKKFKQQTLGLKLKDRAFLNVTFEVRRAWNEFNHGAVGAYDNCKVKKLLPKAKFEFKRFIHSRTNPARKQAWAYLLEKDQSATPQPDSPKQPAQS